MRTKNIFMLLAAGVLLATSAMAQGQQIREDVLPPMTPKLTAAQAPASAPTVTHDRDWYAAKTYTWTDANGRTHTASLVDEVTDPYQMYDMLKWVYCNPEIPGNKTTAVTNSNVYYGRQYWREPYLLVFSRDVEPGWNISDNDVTAPDEDGHTLFLVKVKNYNDQPTNYTRSKSDLINYFTNYIESIELITDAMRAGTGNNQGTMVNIEGEFNRFFIIGKGKSFYWEPNAFNNNPPLAPFYNMFEEYSPTTTEAGATTNDFYESMMAGNVFPVIHDCGSVIYFAHYFSMDGKTSTEEKALSGMILFIPDNRNAHEERDYDNEHQPTVGMYTIELDANAAPAAEELTYDVTLDWTSSLNTVVESIIPQTYEVYIVITDENGNQHNELLTTTTETTYTYQVPQEEHSYSIDYIVHGVVTQSPVFEAWSNIDGVIIPGTNDFLFLELDHYESDYVASEELNYYRNFMKVQNEDAVNALTVDRVNAGENSFVLYRFDFNAPEVLIPVAQLDLVEVANGVHYTIDYQNQEAKSDYNYTPVTADNLSVNNQGVINLNNILFEDQFTANTAENNHPSRYGYVLMQNNIDNPKSTNTVEVPVLKTGSIMSGFYTLEEVMADTDAQLTPGVKNAGMEMTLANNPAIYYYTIERGNNDVPNEAISKLQRRSDASYMEMSSALGHFGEIYPEGEFFIKDELVETGSIGDYMTYLPVIWTFGLNRVAVDDDNDNSYGSPIWKTGVGDVTGTIGGYCTTGTNGVWTDENNQTCCIYYPTVNATGFLPMGSNLEYEPFMFRVWRKSTDVRGYTWDGTKPVNNPDGDTDPFKLIIEQVGDDMALEVGGDYTNSTIGFGALKNANIEFVVRFYYKKTGENLTRDEKPMYYVVEATLPWREIPTGIAEINAANVVSKIYFNAQGVKSDKPFDGVNIVVTRYSDGSTRTTKVVR